jgi:hypothetical protein
MMERSTLAFVKKIAGEHQVTLTTEYASDGMNELIEQLHQKTGRQVVVLIDEYDMPILDALNDSSNMQEIRNFLQSFYKILKAADEHLRFVFLTGVSKFSKVSVFSGLNNLNDITLDTKYATLCGYTQTELEFNFDLHIQSMADSGQTTREELLSAIQDWYDGYSWNGETSVYNPFSTLLLFDKKEFNNYWFATGTPTFLVNLIKERNDVNKLSELVILPSSGFESNDPDKMETVQLLFQTGYLTVKKKERDPFGDTFEYTLGIPNREVQESLMSHLFAGYSGYSALETEPMRNRLRRHLLDCDEEGFCRDMQAMFAHIPYQLHIPREAYYHSLLLLWLKLLGFEVEGEVSTDKGRIDAVWTWRNHAVVAELKYRVAPAEEVVSPDNLTPLVDEAMAQIKSHRYHERYAGYQITLAALAFTGKDIACRLERL